jgi:hypothetical protein
MFAVCTSALFWEYIYNLVTNLCLGLHFSQLIAECKYALAIKAYDGVQL